MKISRSFFVSRRWIAAIGAALRPPTKDMDASNTA